MSRNILEGEIKHIPRLCTECSYVSNSVDKHYI